MNYFVEPNDAMIDAVGERMSKNPAFEDRYEAIKELREADRTGLSVSVDKAAEVNGFFRVASLQGPLADLAKVLNPDWMKNKKNFYGWLDRNKQHCTYDRRRDAVSKRLTHVDGKVVI